MSLPFEAQRLSLKEAQKEAASLQEKVGDHGETEDYKDAYSELIAEQTKEKLANSNWEETLRFNVAAIDRNEDMLNQSSRTKRELTEQKRRIEDQIRRSRNLEDNQKLFAEVLEKIEKGASEVPVGLYDSDLYFVLIDIAKSASDKELKNSIWQKLSDASFNNRDTKNTQISEVTLTPEEIDLLKKAIQKSKENSVEEFASLGKSLKESRAKYEEAHSISLAEEQELMDLHDITIAAIEVLDQREEEQGAPAYPDETEAAENKHKAYLNRIDWRKKQLDKIGYMKVPRGKEISRKWAIYAKMDGHYFLLNKGHEYDDVHPVEILTYRIPERTPAVYAEGMMMARGDASLQAVINNGILEKRSELDVREYEKDLNAHLLELKIQIR